MLTNATSHMKQRIYRSYNLVTIKVKNVSIYISNRIEKINRIQFKVTSDNIKNVF